MFVAFLAAVISEKTPRIQCSYPNSNLCFCSNKLNTTGSGSDKLFWQTEKGPRREDVIWCQKASEQPAATCSIERTLSSIKGLDWAENFVSLTLLVSVYGSRLKADKWCVCAEHRQDRLGSTSLHLTRTDSYLLTPHSILMLHSHAVGIMVWALTRTSQLFFYFSQFEGNLRVTKPCMLKIWVTLSELRIGWYST